MDRVIAAVRERAMLLILDNCEHVIESAATFAHQVLGECRRLRILATSREPLGITRRGRSDKSWADAVGDV